MDDSYLAAALDHLPDVILIVDDECRLKWGNEAAQRFFGWQLDEWVGTSGLELIHPDDLDLAVLSLSTVQQKEQGLPLEVRLRTTTGWRLVEVVGAPMQGGDSPTILLSVRDLTERRRWEVARDEVAKFRSLVQNAASVTMLVSRTGTVEAASGALTRILGHDPESVQGKPLANLVEPADRGDLWAAFVRSFAGISSGGVGREVVEVNLRRRKGDGTVPFEITIVNLLDDPTVGGFVVSGHDISRLRAAQNDLKDLVNRDSLTGLPNRSALDRHLATVLAGAMQTGEQVAVAFLDLDRFKPINDLLGHEAGDELLETLAARLQATVRPEDFVARFGGDEFVVVASVNDGDAASLVERLEEEVARPFDLATGPAQVFASVGLAMSTPEHTAETLLAEADSRMYSVKRGRRGNPLEPVMALGQRRLLAEQLAFALPRQELVVYYQPIVDIHDERLIGFEALIRWQHPQRGLLRPADFLGVAEDAGREAEIGEFVLRTACEYLATLDSLGYSDLTVSVNLSASQLTGQEFVEVVESILTENRLRPKRLCLEITERSILDRPAHGPSTPVSVTLQALADLGVRLAVDDFGTGYSSLTHVLQFPIDVVKIDQSFVSGVATDRQRRSVVAAVIELAKGMGTTAVAEGIDRPEQLEALRSMNCPLGQGYLLGRPAPSGALPWRGWSSPGISPTARQTPAAGPSASTGTELTGG